MRTKLSRSNQSFKEILLVFKFCTKDCVLIECYNSCTCCTFPRSVTKERFQMLKRNASQRCLFCRSLSLRPSCNQCPQCCRISTYREPTAKFLASLAKPLFKSKMKPPLIRSHQIISRYANPFWKSYMRKA